MDVEAFVKKLGPWVPLMIAAGYFVFLIMMWQAFVNEQSVRRTKLDEMLDSINSLSPEKPASTEE